MRYLTPLSRPLHRAVFATLAALAVVQPVRAEQVTVTYGMPSTNLTSNLANVSGSVTLPVYGTKPFSTTTHVHGSVPAELDVNFSAATHAATLTGITFVSSPGSLSFDNVSIHIQWSGFLAPSADVSTNNLVGSLATPDPPGPVTGGASPFSWDAYYHTMQMDNGMAHVVGHYLGNNYPQDVSFNAPPYNLPQPGASQPGVTFGSVSITAGAPHGISIDSSGYHEAITYTTSSQVPIAVSEDFAFDTGFAGTATGQINVTGGQTGNIISTLSTTFNHTFTYLPGDANLDGVVNDSDLSLVLANYNKAGTWAGGDFNSDGLVNANDLIKVLANFNKSSADGGSGPHSSIPEPGTLVLLAAGGLALLGRTLRRHIIGMSAS